MAVIKIQRSERGTAEYKTPNVSALRLDQSLALVQGQGFAAIGEAIKKTAEKTKKTEDQNQLHDLTIKSLPIITDTYSKYKLSTNVTDSKTFLDELDIKNFEEVLTNANPEVKAGFKDFLVRQQLKLYPKLKSEITLRHVAKSYQTDDEMLNGYVLDMASSDRTLNFIGQSNLDAWFIDPNNVGRYDPKALADKKKSKLLLAREYQIMFDADETGGLPTLENKRAIIKEFGAVKGEEILQNVRTKFISQQIQKDLEEDKLEKQDSQQKIENFSAILNSINNSKALDGETENLYTFDDVTDLFKAGEINSAQYEVLLDFYSKGEKISDSRIIDEVNYQIAIAESVEDLDAINNQLNFSLEFAKGLGVKDITNFSKVFKRLKNDRDIFQDYKYYKTQINTVLGKADGFRSKWDTAQVNEKLVRIDAVNEYNRLVGDGVRVDDAYNRIVKQFADEKNIPTLYQMKQPTTISSVDFKELIKKEGAGGFDKVRDMIAEQYSEDKIDMKAFKLDMDRMDMIEDLYEMRKSIPGMIPDFATAENNSGKEGKD